MIDIRNLSMGYGGIEVLNVPNLQLNKGTSYGIVGHNGAGKTTLFKCMTNIIYNYKGEVLIDGQNVKKNTSVLTKVGIVLDGMSVYQSRTGWFNIQYFSKLRGVNQDERARQLAEDLDIAAVLNKPVKTYSYGMQKKLILLIALLHMPEILILDEPFRGLDVETVKWFKKYLKYLTNQGLTLFISSHVQSDIEELCDEVFIIDKGRIMNHINLRIEKQKLIRDVVTDNNYRFVELLQEFSVPYIITETQKVRIDMNQAGWAQVNEKLQDERIAILEMAQVNVLENHLN